MRIGLVGAGAVGSLLAASLFHNSVPFQWLVRNPLRRKQLNWLSVEADGERRRFLLPIDCLHASLEELPEVDWYILVVKAQHVAELLMQLPPGKPSLVVANGLHAGPLHLGLLYGGARLDEAGSVHAGALNSLWTGPLGIDLINIAALAGELKLLLELLAAPWLTGHYAPDIRQRMWHKLALNCVVNPLTALLDCPNGALLPQLASPLVNGVLHEVMAVAAAELGIQPVPPGVELLHKDLVELVTATATNSSSMREDLRHGRDSEIGVLNAAVAARGQSLGVRCPLNKLLASTVLTIAETNRGG